MKRRIFQTLLWLIVACVGALPALAQEKLYPVISKSNGPTLMNSDHTAFVAEKIGYKLTVGSADDDRTGFLPATRARIIVFWIRLENLTEQPLQLNVEKFTMTDAEGRPYRMLTTDEAANRVISGAGGASALLSKTLRGVSLGRTGKVTEEQVKEDVVRYNLKSAQVGPRGVKDGLVYFEAPQAKNYSVNLNLGDLWSKSFTFSTTKLK
jgi:hypothetical protein